MLSRRGHQPQQAEADQSAGQAAAPEVKVPA
jgi:hypothetical protein